MRKPSSTPVLDAMQRRRARTLTREQSRDADGRFGSGSGPATVANATPTPVGLGPGGSHFNEITAGQLTAEGHATSPAVTSAQYQQMAAQGQAHLDEAKAQGSPPTAINDRVQGEAFAKCQESWGGATIDSHTGEIITAKTGLSVSTKEPGQPSITMSDKASAEEFKSGMDQAQKEYAPQLAMKGGALGVFHDDTLGKIQIDPAIVVGSKEVARNVGAATHAVGGAYDFATGNGVFPPHVGK